MSDLASLIIGRLEVPSRTVGYIQTDEPVWRRHPDHGVRFETPRGELVCASDERVYLVGVKVAPPPVRAERVQIGDIIQGWGRVISVDTFCERMEPPPMHGPCDLQIKIIVDDKNAIDALDRLCAEVQTNG